MERNPNVTGVQKKRAIKSYIQNLPGLLGQDYGKSKIYTPKQVEHTIKRYGLNVVATSYAVAMFSERDAFDQYHHDSGEIFDYNTMRGEVADQYFNGDSGFEISDIELVSSNFQGSSDISDFSDAGGDGSG